MFFAKNKNISYLVTAGLFCSMLLLAGCPKKMVKRSPGDRDGSSEADAMSAEGDLLDPLVDVAEADIRGGGFVDVEELKVVRFEYDRYGLTRSARNTLKKNAAYLTVHSEFQVLIEGHTDERGTLGYNLSLGQRRGKAVRDYYMRLGVPGTSIGTISYGEEKPVCGEQIGKCWRKNRRAESKVRDAEESGDRAILSEDAASELR